MHCHATLNHKASHKEHFHNTIYSLACVLQVRLAYLSNERLVWLQQQSHSLLPVGLLLQGCMQRLQMQDQPCELASALMQPRGSYCSNLQYGLPGGQEYVDVPVHHIWQLLAPSISVKVSGQRHRPLPPSHFLLMLLSSSKHECRIGSCMISCKCKMVAYPCLKQCFHSHIQQ